MREYYKMTINARTELYCIFGKPVRHSMSPIIHNTAFHLLGMNAVYLAFEPLSIREGISAMRSLGIRGASVTIPFKVDALSYIDAVDPLAAKIGAANTLHYENGRITGYNTDGFGAVQSLKESGVTVRNARVLVIGNGGSARAIAFTMLDCGAEVVITGRNRERISDLAKDLSAHYPSVSRILIQELDRAFMKDVNIIINTTPVGMEPDRGAIPIDPELIDKGHTVFDIIYAPAMTRLLAASQAQGCKIIGGIEMLINQGIRQFEIWTGSHPPRDEIIKALKNDNHNS
jgi:shikimate dehydrogenase